MKEKKIYFHPRGSLIALVGNPNCGKTALFNRLTGSHQKVANYAGVTVERKEGSLQTARGKNFRLLDLPGVYSLYPRSPDERVTVDVLYGRAQGEKRPDLVLCILDATNLRRSLRLALAVKRLGLPCIAVLNKADLAKQRGLNIDAKTLSAELGLPVVKTVAVQKSGTHALRELLNTAAIGQPSEIAAPGANQADLQDSQDPLKDHQTVCDILERLNLTDTKPHQMSDRIDQVALHPVWGPILLTILLFLMFQAVFSWAELPMTWIENASAWLGQYAGELLPSGWFKSLLVDGLIAGVGGVIVFLPQIIILFFFILSLEESGYLPRAAFLLDRIMGSVGLSGRSFIPLLSSFACAIPGIMATRTIANQRDRLVTILIAPLMTCSARLPVYTLLIGAFIPSRTVWGYFQLQGLVLFALYLLAIVGAMLVAWVLKKLTTRNQMPTLMMELPNYHLPRIRNIAMGLWQRIIIFLKRVGGVILVLTVLLWFLSSFPQAPIDATKAAIEYSFAGMLGHQLAIIFAPIGFNWQISVALIPGLAAREVAISALGTVYALSSTVDNTAQALTPLIKHSWSMATALSLLMWYVFAPMCLSTIATIKRETGGWKIPLITMTYLFALAYAAAFVTYQIATAMGW